MHNKILRTHNFALIQTSFPVEISNNANIGVDEARIIYDKIQSKNLDLITEAKKHGADAIFLNELSTAPYFAIEKKYNPTWSLFSEDAESGPTIKIMKKISKRLSVLLVVPIYEHDFSKDKYFNTTLIIDKGNYLGKVRKTHVPFGENEHGTFAESYYFEPNDNPDVNPKASEKIYTKYSDYLPVFDTSVGKIGVNICYGRHFYENWEALVLNGAQLVFVPSVTFGDVSERLWESELPTMAVWNSIFIGASNRLGKEFKDRKSPIFFGKSYFVGPDGRKLKNLYTGLMRDNIIISKLDLSLVGHNPAGWSLLRGHRKDILK